MRVLSTQKLYHKGYKEGQMKHKITKILKTEKNSKRKVPNEMAKSKAVYYGTLRFRMFHQFRIQ